MKKQATRAFRFALIAGLGLVAVSNAADAMSRRQCRQEWRANKAAFKTQGKTKRTFMKACRGGTMPSAQPAPAPAQPGTAH